MKDKHKLFCFTYAGGTSAFFDEIEKELPGVDVIKPEYAGHGNRRRECFYESFDELADDMIGEIRDRLIGDYALLGYSMGSITLVEVLKRIIAEGMPMPTHVFLAAHEPHTKSELLGYTTDELDEWVKQRTINFGGVPDKLVNNKTFWRMYLPLYRADYSIIGRYEFEKLALKTTVPATVFYSETDTPFSDMRLWEKYFVENVDYYRYDGNHFFIHEHHKEIADVIREKLGAEV